MALLKCHMHMCLHWSMMPAHSSPSNNTVCCCDCLGVHHTVFKTSRSSHTHPPLTPPEQLLVTTMEQEQAQPFQRAAPHKVCTALVQLKCTQIVTPTTKVCCNQIQWLNADQTSHTCNQNQRAASKLKALHTHQNHACLMFQRHKQHPCNSQWDLPLGFDALLQALAACKLVHW